MGQPFSIDMPSCLLRSMPAPAFSKSSLRVYESEKMIQQPSGARPPSVST